MAVDFLLRPLPVCAIESGEGEARKCETSKLSVIQRVQFLGRMHRMKSANGNLVSKAVTEPFTGFRHPSFIEVRKMHNYRGLFFITLQCDEQVREGNAKVIDLRPSNRREPKGDPAFGLRQVLHGGFGWQES